MGYHVALACTGLALLATCIGESLPAEPRAAVLPLPLPVTGHAVNSRWHEPFMVSMELRILAATVWAGGLFAVVALLAPHRALLADALPRFSVPAGVCLVMMAATGLVNGIAEEARAPGRDLISGLAGTGYSHLVLGKVLCLLGLAALGGNIRWLPAIIEHKPTALLRWAAFELTVMGVAFGFAGVLSRAPVA